MTDLPAGAAVPGPTVSPDLGTPSHPGDTADSSNAQASQDTPSGSAVPRNYPYLGPADQPGDLGRLGPYRVLRLLDEGGMGSVFLAEDEALRRRVALKVMRPDVAARPTARERFLREGRAAAAIKNDHVVTIYQVGEANGVPYLALELLDGCSLDDWLKARPGPAPADKVATVARDVLRGLAAAHAKGLVHRDIKPANLWLEGSTGRVKVLDFGLTRPQADDSPLTYDGALLGTPSYMAPEQAEGKKVDARADLWSLGVVLYRMASGTNPFQRDSVYATLKAVSSVMPPSATKLGGLPGALARLIDRLLSRDPASRPADAGVALREWQSDESSAAKTPVRRTPRRRPVAAWVGLAVLVVAGLVPVVWARIASHKVDALDTGSLTTGQSAGPVAIGVEQLDVRVYELIGEDTYRLRGILGAEGGVFTAHTTDAVTVEARLSRPGYCFLLAFQGDGKVVGLYPQDEGDVPELTDHPVYPAKRRDSKFGLEDGDGLWAVALVVSAERLPSFADWRKAHPNAPWRRQPKPIDDLVMKDDGQLFQSFTPGQPASSGVRAEKTDKNVSPLIEVVEWLQRETNACVAAVAFPVVKK